MKPQKLNKRKSINQLALKDNTLAAHVVTSTIDTTFLNHSKSLEIFPIDEGEEEEDVAGHHLPQRSIKQSVL